MGYVYFEPVCPYYILGAYLKSYDEFYKDILSSEFSENVTKNLISDEKKKASENINEMES